MALQVWLPLRGDLHNQGLIDDLLITNSGAAINSLGKIGSCYTFDGNDDYIALNSAKLRSLFTGGNKPFSIAFWIYHADASRAIIFGDYGLTGGMSFNIELTTGHNIRFYWGGTPDYTFTPALAQSQWEHIAITYNGSQIICYKNGIICTNPLSQTLDTKSKAESDFYLGRDSRTGTTALNGKLNDIRIYDHCLSPEEVADIAKGLVLHYKLDNNGLGNPNLYPNSPTEWKAITVSSSYGSVDINTSKWGLQDGEKYTFSLDVKVPTTTKNLKARTQFFNSNSDRPGDMGLQALSNGEARLYVSGTVRSGYGRMDLMLDSNTSSSASAETCYYKNVKIERGLIPTPFSPKPGDPGCPEDYSTTVYDSSGYGNNGTVVGSLSAAAGSPKFAVSTQVTKGASGIRGADPSYVTNGSVALWVKIDSLGSSGWLPISGNNGIGYLMATSSGTGAFYHNNVGSNTKLYYFDGVQKSTPENLTTGWHHVVMTGIDLSTWNDISLNLYSSVTSTTWNSTCNYSDVRLYSTVLTAADVAKLYQDSMIVDSSGNVSPRGAS